MIQLTVEFQDRKGAKMIPNRGQRMEIEDVGEKNVSEIEVKTGIIGDKILPFLQE